jgi:hypothetical protein
LQLTYKEKLKVLKTMERLDTVKTFNFSQFHMEQEVKGGGEVRDS